MKVLLPIDGSQHSAAALEDVAARQFAGDAARAVEIVGAGPRVVSVRS